MVTHLCQQSVKIILFECFGQQLGEPFDPQFCSELPHPLPRQFQICRFHWGFKRYVRILPVLFYLLYFI